MKQIKIGILGGGVGGLVCASELNYRLGTDTQITVIDRSPYHLFQPALLHLALGERKLKAIQRPLERLRKQNTNFVNSEITNIDVKQLTVNTKKDDFKFDYLVVGLGAKLNPSAISGFEDNAYNLYSSQGAEQINKALKEFSGGKIAIVIASLPFKCPAAPYEMAFLLDYYFKKRKIRQKVEIVLATPEPQPMPLAGKAIGPMVTDMLAGKDIEYLPNKQLKSVEKTVLLDKQRIKADLVIGIPNHSCPDVIVDSGLAKKGGWIKVDKFSLETEYKNIHAIGDNAAIALANGKPLPKAGVFAKSQAQIVAFNLAHKIGGKTLEKKYMGEGGCFIEVGHKKAAFASGDFYHEPEPLFDPKKA
ncbi:MAG: hypothetical protein E3J54_06060, partial [Actinobacteria bacterium]